MSMKDEVESALREEHDYEEVKGKTDTPVNLHANLRVEKRDAESDVLTDSREVENIITNLGADYVRTTVGSAPLSNAFSWTAVGTDQGTGFASTDSRLNTAIAKSKNSFNTVNGNEGQFSNVTTFTNISATVKESGLFNDGTALNTGTALALQTFNGVTLSAGDNLEVIWKVYFSQ